MDPYIQKFNDYLRIRDGSTDNCSDRNSNRVYVSDSGYGRIIQKAEYPGRSLSSSSVTAVGENSSLPNYEATSCGSRSLPASNIASPIRSAPDYVAKNDNSKRTVGAIESFVVNGLAPQKLQTPDYKIYERGNIIASSKFATPKQIETIASTMTNNPTHNCGNSGTLCLNGIPESNRSYQCYSLKSGAISPTHSHSGSSKDSQHSPSASLTVHGNSTSPLYENIEYFGRSTQSNYYHVSHSPISSLGSQDSKHSSPRGSITDGGQFESAYRKAQPQVPTGVKYSTLMHRDQPPYEAPPVYENIQDLQLSSNKYGTNHEPAKPGPQVAVYSGHNAVNAGKQEKLSNAVKPVCVGNLSSVPYSNNFYHINSNSENSPSLNKTSDLKNVHYSDNPTKIDKPTDTSIISQCRTIPISPVHSVGKCEILQPQSNSFKNLSKLSPEGNVIHDYNVKSDKSHNAPVQLATSFQRGAAPEIANAVNPDHYSMPFSPMNPDKHFTGNSGNSIGKAVNGKTLLPYNVTPPRPTGPTEAERKIEELTRQLEEEMEKQEEEGEYFDTWLAENPEWAQWIRKVDGETAECKLCIQRINVKYEGKGAVVSHCSTSKHTNCLANIKKSQTLSKFFVKRDCQEELLVTASEVTFAHHGVIHGISYNGQDCGNKLLPKLACDSQIASKISCGRTKTASIIEGVLGPHAQDCLIKDVKNNGGIFSISSDASNVRNKKFFPVTLQYFSSKTGINHGVLDFYEDSNETSDAITQRITDIIENSNLSLSKSFCLFT